MKYVKLVIMTVLIFGVAISPVFSGTVYAQSEKTEKEKKEQRSDESKQQKIEQETQAKERQSQRSDTQPKEKHIEDSEAKAEKRETQQKKRVTAQELQEQRRAELERIQERMNKVRSPMTEAMDKLVDAGVLEPTPDPIGNLLQALTPRNNSIDISSNEAGQYFSELSNMISEQKRSQDKLYTQMNILLNLVSSMCEGKVIVVGISDGMPRCVEHDQAVNLQSRGMVTLFR